MANFKTHITTAALAGAALAGGGWHAGLWPPTEALILFSITTLGGLLPDIDADNSRAVRLVFTLLALAVAAIGVISLRSRLLPLCLTGVACQLYMGTRYVLSNLFKHFTAHRGLWHSLLAIVLMAGIAAVLGFHLFHEPALHAWCWSAALGLGMLLHLLLDECCSIDFKGARVKRSFGTALKLYDYRKPFTALVMVLMIVALAPWLPPWHWPPALKTQALALTIR